MPAGVAWPTYLKFSCAALATMLAGSQVVHMYYNPLNDMDKYLAEERKQLEQKQVLQHSNNNTNSNS